MSEIIAGAAKKVLAAPRPLAETVAEDVAIEKMAQRYARIVSVPMDNSTAADNPAMAKLIAAALERAAEIVRSRAKGV